VEDRGVVVKELKAKDFADAQAIVARINAKLGYPRSRDHQSACAIVCDTDTGEYAVIVEDNDEGSAFKSNEKAKVKPFDNAKWNGSRNK